VLAYTTNFASNTWGKTGHRTIGKIAENHLTKKAKKNIDKLLGGQSLAFVSTFADDIKSDKSYRKYSPWHYVNKPFHVSYEASEKNTKGDIIIGINKCIAVLEDENASKNEKVFYLKMLVHFIGDMHQPMHAGRKEDKGGNTIQIRWFSSGTNLHSVWDSKMLNHFDMSYTELAENLDVLSKKQVKFLQEGDIITWINETSGMAKKVYNSVEVGEKLGYNYMYNYFDVAELQLQKGGVRLAKVLNQLFG